MFDTHDETNIFNMLAPLKHHINKITWTKEAKVGINVTIKGKAKALNKTQ